MKKLFAILFLGLSLGISQASAHEGHDHDAPTTLKPLKGGVIKALDESRVEVLSKGKSLKIFFYDNEMKPLSAEGFTVKAQAQHPRTKKTEPVAFAASEGALVAQYDAKSLHRYTLKLEIKDLKAGHTYNLSFVIEPRQ